MTIDGEGGILPSAQWLHKYGGSLPSPAGGIGDNHNWSQSWKLHLPAKIKILRWRILHGLLPCRGEQANRRFGCPMRSEGCEDIKHLIFIRRRAM
jgi:hypothetical protein